MATAIAKTSNSLAEGLLPQQGIARWVTFFMLALAGSIVLWVSAKTSVPFFPVPMTLQTLAILVIAATYGFRLALASVMLYMLEGALGIPVFSATPERGIGLTYMMGPTAGYLVGFVIATGLVGWFAERGADTSMFKLFGIMLFAAALILGLGFAYLSYFVGIETAFNIGVMPFVLGDLLKVAIAAMLVPTTAKLIRT